MLALQLRLVYFLKCIRTPRILISFSLLFFFSVPVASAICQSGKLFGVNVAGAEFGSNLPGRVGRDYFYPTEDYLESIASKGFNLIRVPVKWERIQPVAFGHLNQPEIQNLERMISFAERNGICLLIDLHNYGQYYRIPLSKNHNLQSALIHFWALFSERIGNSKSIALGLMNEPIYLEPGEWINLAGNIVQTLRYKNANHMVFIASPRWSGLHEWNSVINGVHISKLLDSYFDPINNSVIELHQYFDTGYAGKKSACLSPEELGQVLSSLLSVTPPKGMKFFLGEFGGSDEENCLSALRTTIRYIKMSDSWIGWSYWAAGEHWDRYVYRIYPGNEAVSELLENEIENARQTN